MIKNFTPNDVLKNQSGELPTEESEHLNASISESPDLETFVDAIKQLEKQVPTLLSGPSDRPLKNIMDYVKKNIKDK